MTAILVLPPSLPSADIGMIMLENGAFTPMAGSSAMCAVTALLEMQILPATEPRTVVRVETAAGVIEADALLSGGRVRSVTIRNVPSFVFASNVLLDVPDLGQVRVDVAYGGQFYVIASAEEMGIEVTKRNARQLAQAGVLIQAVARRDIAVAHPDNPRIDEITWAMLTGPLDTVAVRSRSCTVAAPGAPDRHDIAELVGTIDRSPCGTGTSARMALMRSRSTLGMGQDFIHEGILGTHYTGRIVGLTTVGSFDAVESSVTGRAWITGHSQYVLEDDDPFPEGYTLGDIWGARESLPQ